MTWPVRWDELPLARSSVDRAAVRRERPGLLDELAALASTRVVLSLDGRVAVHALRPGSAAPDGRVALDLRPTQDLLARAPGAERYFLGQDDDGDYLALVLPPGAVGEGELTWASLREVGSHLDARDAGLAATTVALAAWHDSHRHCPRCGAPAEVTFAGWQRTCVAEGTVIYPRTDPAVIMAVTDEDDRVLLGHASHWAPRRFSTLAGFVEAGESAEQALRREVLEEVALPVGDIEYRGSQSWPFPASLMLAYRARATATDVVVDGVELAEARWFDRKGLLAASSSGEIVLPGRASIARALIEDWYGGILP